MTDNITQKKDEIARVFMKYFQEYGMKNTIVNDIAKELGMSKKTIYKYFSGGKQEALYFFFYRIANQYVEILEPELEGFSPQEKLEYLIKQIFKQGKPFILANVVENEEDYSIENQIVGRAFKVAYQKLLKEIIHEGIKEGYFSPIIEMDLLIITSKNN